MVPWPPSKSQEAKRRILKMRRALEKLDDACAFYGKEAFGRMVGSSRAGINLWNSRGRIAPGKIPVLMLAWPDFRPEDFLTDEQRTKLLRTVARAKREKEKEAKLALEDELR
jgi:hypothetical protein